LVGFVQHAMGALENFHQQLDPVHPSDIARNLGGVHP